MRTKIVISLGIIFFSNFLFGQDKTLAELEKLADSLYYNQSIYTSENEFKKELEIRNHVLRLHTNNTSVQFKTSLAKKHASKAAFLSSKMEYDSAITISKKAIEIYNKIEKQDLFFLGHVYKNLYDQYTNIGDRDQVLKLTEKTLKIFKDTLVENHKLVAEVEFDIGKVLNKFGDYTLVINQYKKAITKSIAFQGENNADAAYYEHNLALVYNFMGYYRKELESYKNVIRRWESTDYHDMSYLTVAYGSLSNWYLRHGDFKTAEKYLVKRENLVKKHKTELKNWHNETFLGRTQVETWQYYADLFLFKKDTAKALLYNNKALNYLEKYDINDRKNNPNNLSYYKNFVYLNIYYSLKFEADIFKKRDPKKAIQLYQQAYNSILKSSSNVSILTNRLDLIESYISLEDYDIAKQILKEEINEAIENERYYDLIQLYAIQADIAIELDDVDAMDKKYELLFYKFQKDTLRIIPIENLKQEDCKPYGNNEIVNLLLKAGKNYEKAFVKTRNDDYLKKAYNLNALTSSIFSENFSFLVYNDQTYHTVSTINEQLLSTALLVNDKDTFENVIQNIEDSNSRLSWKKFLNSRQKKYLNIPDSILVKENDLKSALHFYKKSLFVSNDGDLDKNKLWKEKILDIERELETLERWFQKNYSSYYNQVQKRFNLSGIKQKLKKKQKIIKYIFAEDNVYAFILTENKTSLIKIDDKKELTERLKSYIKSVTDIKTKGYKTQAFSLYNVLLPRLVLDPDKKQNLIFIMDDVLHYLPMEVLIDSKGDYLIQRHQVSYATSLLLWDEQLKAKKSKRNKIGIFAPTYKNYKEKNPKRNDSTLLLGAYNEAIDIAKMFRADVFSGKNSSKQEFINKAKEYNILHLAMHSTINNTDSEFSNLSFSSNDNDNKLFISELYNVSLNADLAVLSACNTGAGELKKGEGLINVSRAFTYAGVPSTVTSLWNVPDKETSQIMISFYKYLKSGKSKSKALQQAKIDYLIKTEDPLLKHPYYWAGFVVSGNTSPIHTDTHLWIYILGAVLITGFIFRKKVINLFE